MVLRVIITIIEIILCFLLQTVVFTTYSPTGIIPDLLMVITIGNAFMRGRTTGLLTGFVCGLLLDCCYGSGMGLCALLYMVTGYLAGYVARFYLPDDYTLPTLLIAAGELLYCLMYYVTEYMLRGKLHIGTYFGQIILPKIAFTVFAGVFLYRIMNGVNLRLAARKPKEENQNHA